MHKEVKSARGPNVDPQIWCLYKSFIKQIRNKSEDYDNQEVPRDCRHAPTLI